MYEILRDILVSSVQNIMSRSLVVSCGLILELSPYISRKWASYLPYEVQKHLHQCLIESIRHGRLLVNVISTGRIAAFIWEELRRIRHNLSHASANPLLRLTSNLVYCRFWLLGSGNWMFYLSANFEAFVLSAILIRNRRLPLSSFINRRTSRRYTDI